MSRKFWMAIIALVMIFSGAATYSGGSRVKAGNLAGSPGLQRGLQIIGLTSDQRLITFDERFPEAARTIGLLTGFVFPDTRFVGIDFRVQDGKLYGLGNGGGVYTINPNTAFATLVNRLTVPLSGTLFGVDFNPAADRLRIISDNGQNLRHNVNAGGVTIADQTLNYTPGTPATGVTGAAYTNNDLNANTGTTLLDLDSNLDQVAIQSPPNNGSLVATGKLGVNTAAVVGFDIYSTVRNGITVGNVPYASLTLPDGSTSLNEIDLLTGNAKLSGVFRSQDKVIDIAIPLNQF